MRTPNQFLSGVPPVPYQPVTDATIRRRTFAPQRRHRHGPVSPKPDACTWPDRPKRPQSLLYAAAKVLVRCVYESPRRRRIDGVRMGNRAEMMMGRAHMRMWKRTILMGAGAVAMLVVSAACVKVDTGREDPSGRPPRPPPRPPPRRRQRASKRITMPTSGSCAT